MKNDPRARYTRSVIENAFLTLIREKKQISRVTVSDICKIAEINRGTFYRYYLDVYDLAEKMMDQGIEQIRMMIANEGGKSFTELFSSVLRVLQKDRAFFSVLMSNTFGENGVNTYMHKLFTACFEQLHTTIPCADVNEQVRLLAYISGGSGALIEYWLLTDNGESPEEIAELIGKYAEILISNSDT